MTRYCKDCGHFDLSVYEEGDRSSWCLRYPPVYLGPTWSEMTRTEDVPNDLAYWDYPTTAILATCGEWTPREEVEDESTHKTSEACRACETETIRCIGTDVAQELADAYDEMKAENAKLRELVAEVIRLMQANGPDCGICKHYDECWTGEAMDYSPSGCVICNEARELGIEVD